MYKVRILEDQEKDGFQWTDYVERHPESTSDHSWEWRAIIKDSFNFKPYYLGAFNQGQLAGILPLFHVPRGFGRSALVSIPFGNYGGICADSLDATHVLLEHAKNLMKNLKCSHVKLLHKSPLSCEGLKTVDEQARYSMPIESSKEDIFLKWGSSNRKKMRKSKKDGVTISPSCDTGPLYEIHLHKFRCFGTPCFPRSYFDFILKHFGNRAQIYYAYSQNKVVAFDLIIFFKKSMVVIMGGGVRSIP